MKKLLFTVLFACCTCLYGFAQISASEYFFDTDPGPGQGTPISITPGNTVNFTQSFSVSALQPGFHFLAIRTKETSGSWGLPEARGFYITNQTVNSTDVTAAEYFFDTDPGPGNGTSLPVTAGNTVSFPSVIPLGSLPAGFHFLAVRTKDASGSWGLFETRGFYISASFSNAPEIVAAEYYYNTDPGPSNGIPITLPAPGTTFSDSLVLPLGSLPLGTHQIAIRVKDASGKWGLLENRAFTVCNTYGPLSRMDFHIEGNKVFFNNYSVNNDTTRWEFGDGNTDTVLNPVKTYAVAGDYTVRLITMNGCARDTMTAFIRIMGIQRINASKGGNQGVASVIFDGNGFTNSTPVKLLKNGVIKLPEEKRWISTNRILAYFNLTGSETGSYDAVADLGGGILDTLRNGFTISQAVYPMVSIIESSGTNVRTGRNVVSNQLQNRGNEDAIMLPFASVIGYKPGTIAILPLEQLADLTNKGIFQNTFQYLAANGISTAVMSAVDVDTVRKKQLLSYYRIKVPAETKVNNYFRIVNTYGDITYSIRSLVHPPLFKSEIVLDDLSAPNARDCMNSFLKKAVKKNIAVTINDAAWTNCFNTAFDTLARTVRDIVRDLSQQDKSIPMKSVFATLLAQIAQCGGTGLPASMNTSQFDNILKDVTYNWLFLENLDSIGRPCFDTTDTYVFNRNVTINANRSASVSQETNRPQADCPNAAAFPELADLCKDFSDPCQAVKDIAFQDGGIFAAVGEYVFDKFTDLLSPPGSDGFCAVNSATIGCKNFCERSSFDPNVKFGPGNNNDNKYVNYLTGYGYTINFENLASASAPAAYVEVTDTLDLTRFDISTFQTGSFGWGDSLVTVDANRTDYSLLKDLRPAHPNQLRVDVRLDTLTGVASWKFYTVDTATLQLTADPAQGFLPPNVNGVEGTGFVSYTIKPKSGVTSGIALDNKARIVFDDNAAILTPVWEHIVDTTSPQSQVAALPPVVTTNDFVVNWSGTDAHAGVGEYAVYVSINDSLYTRWKRYSGAVSDTFHAEHGKTYKFFSVALDKAGNFENAPVNPLLTPDAVTTIALPLTTNWTGNVSTEWDNPGNWSNGVPGTITDVVIPAGRPRYPLVLINVNVHSLRLDPTTTVTISNGKNIVINGN